MKVSVVYLSITLILFPGPEVIKWFVNLQRNFLILEVFQITSNGIHILRRLCWLLPFLAIFVTILSCDLVSGFFGVLYFVDVYYAFKYSYLEPEMLFLGL